MALTPKDHLLRLRIASTNSMHDVCNLKSLLMGRHSKCMQMPAPSRETILQEGSRRGPASAQRPEGPCGFQKMRTHITCIAWQRLHKKTSQGAAHFLAVERQLEIRSLTSMSTIRIKPPIPHHMYRQFRRGVWAKSLVDSRRIPRRLQLLHHFSAASPTSGRVGQR